MTSLRYQHNSQFTLPLHTLFSDSRHCTSCVVALDRIPCSQLGSKPLGEYLRPSEPFIKAEAALRGRRLFGWSAQTAIWHCTIGRVACATRGGGMLQDPRFGYLVLCPFLWFIEVFLYLKRHSVIWKGSFRVVCFFWAAKFASESVGNRFLNTQFSTRSSLSCNIINTSSFASHFMRYLNRSFACSTARLARHSRTSWRIWHPPRVRESEKLKRRPCATRTYTDKDLGELEWRIGWYHPPKRMV